MARLMNSLKLGVFLTLAALIANFVLPFVGIEVVQLYGIQAPTGITPGIGAKFLDFVNGLGIVNIEIASVILTLISATAIAFVGSFIYGKVNVPKGLMGWKKLTAVIVYGTLAFYIVFVGFVLQAWSVYVMLIIYAVFASVLVGLLQKPITDFVGRI